MKIIYYETYEELHSILEFFNVNIEESMQLIPCIMEHKLSNGYKVDLKQPVNGNVSVYVIGEEGNAVELEREKYKYSGSIITLPSYLNKDTKVWIKYFKKKANKDFPLVRIKAIGIDKDGNHIDFIIEPRPEK